MPDDKFVREKLVTRGAEALSDAELLSIVLQEGTSSMSAFELAERLLARDGSGLSALSRMDIRTLRTAEGLGIRKAAVLAAAIELGKRIKYGETRSPDVIESNDDVVRIFSPVIAALPHEEFWVVYLSSANSVISKRKVSQGGVSAATVDHRLIVKHAVESLASAIILVHNHPSGIALPSAEDRELTDKVIHAASLFDIAVHDHLIITRTECFSFRQSGLIR